MVEEHEIGAHGEALQLLRPNKRHSGFEVDATALAALAAIKEPVAVIAAVGPYHG